jgi:hypothetical protein
MNVGRGLFRLWLVMTAIWVCLMWLLLHDAKWTPQVTSDIGASSQANNAAGHKSLGRVPLDDDAEFQRGLGEADGTVARSSTIDDNVAFLRPWMLPAAIPPLIIFVVGACLLWAIRGFRS